MTLRVTFEIVPFGEEENKYLLGTLDIHNVHNYGMGHCVYDGVFNSKGHSSFDNVVKTFSGVEHSRQDGFLILTKKVIETIE